MFSLLSEPQQQALLDAYFGPEGIGYNIIRTSIHSCDLGWEATPYIDEGDTSLATFSIAPDKVKRIPMIQRAAEMTGDELVFYASSMEPAGVHEDQPPHAVRRLPAPEFYDAWAQYFVKFIEAYEAEGLPCGG